MINENETQEQLTRELAKLKEIISDYRQKVARLTQAYEEMKEEVETYHCILQQLPYQLQVYETDGTSILVSNSLRNEFNLPSTEPVIGHYNILKDPAIEGMGLMEHVKRAFAGETISFSNIEVPLKQLGENYHINYDEIFAMYQNGVLLPIFNREGVVIKVVALLNTQRAYKVKENINRAIKFLKENYQKEYDLKTVAKAAGLSPYHFTRIFKEEVGETPKKFFIRTKIEKVKEKLSDRDLSISRAFSECGLDYNGHYAKLFKKIVGVTPSQYRKLSEKATLKLNTAT